MERLLKTVEDGNYYEAQQLIKTLYFRQYTRKKYREAQDILVSGTITMLQAHQTTCATELIQILLKLFTDTNAPVDSGIDTISKLNDLFPSGDQGKISSLKAALKWASTSELYKQGHPALHALLAKAYTEVGEYSLAQKHYLKANQPREFGLMLVTWASEGLKSEQDLFITRAVLMYLTLPNLGAAKVVLDVFVSTLPAHQTPLLNFLKLLLITLEAKTYSVFTALRQAYSTSLNRDPLFNQYLDHIAQVFYSVKQATTTNMGFGSFMSDLFKNLLSNDDGIELDTEDVD